MSDFHIIVIFNDYYTLIVAFLTKQIQNKYRYRRLPDTHDLISVSFTYYYYYRYFQHIYTRLSCYKYLAKLLYATSK